MKAIEPEDAPCYTICMPDAASESGRPARSDSRDPSDLFPIGVHLCRDPMPSMDELLCDLDLIRNLGLTVVKLQINWATTEPVRGRLELARFHQLIRRAEQIGLRVYIGFVGEHAPAWLYRQFPDCRMETRLGVRVPYEAVSTLPADGKPGPCFDHPGARDALLDWLRRSTAELAPHRNVGWWNVWQEAEWWAAQPWLIGEDTCYCPHTLAIFRDWLRERYGTIEALNGEWRSHHADFADIVPTRTRRGYDAQAVDRLWLLFQRGVNIARWLRERAEAVRSADPLRRPVFAHKAACDIGAGFDRHAARSMDFFGFSAYPAYAPFHEWDDGHPSPGRPADRAQALTAEAWNSVALATDHLRACTRDGQVWAAEFQGGPVSSGVFRGRVPDAADIRRWVLHGLAHGLTGLCFWVLREEIHALEMAGFGLLDGVGARTERAAEVARLARALRPFAAEFLHPSPVAAEAAILIDEWNAISQRCLPHAERHLAYDVRGWHRLFFDLGIPVDFLHVADWEERAGSYRALIVPFPLVIADEFVERLRRWVNAGGHAIVEAGAGRLGADFYVPREPSAALRTLLGAYPRRYQLVREPGGCARWSPTERTWDDLCDPYPLEGTGPLSGIRLTPQWWLEWIEPEGAEPVLVARGRDIHGVCHRLGDGNVWYIGTLLGFRGTADRSPEGHGAIAKLLAACGIEPPHRGRLLLRRRRLVSREVWCFYNPYEEELREPVRWPEDVEEIRDLLGEQISFNEPVTVGPLDARLFIVRRASR